MNGTSFCQDIAAFVNEDYEIRYLSERDIEELVARLYLYDCLGYLKDMLPEQRLHDLRDIHVGGYWLLSMSPRMACRSGKL